MGMVKIKGLVGQGWYQGPGKARWIFSILSYRNIKGGRGKGRDQGKGQVQDQV